MSILGHIQKWIMPDSHPVVQQRRLACLNCPSVYPVPLLGNHCRSCGCNLRLKTKISTERCPQGKW